MASVKLLSGENMREQTGDRPEPEVDGGQLDSVVADNEVNSDQRNQENPAEAL